MPLTSLCGIGEAFDRRLYLRRDGATRGLRLPRGGKLGIVDKDGGEVDCASLDCGGKEADLRASRGIHHLAHSVLGLPHE
jgi:hypothetical protein